MSDLTEQIMAEIDEETRPDVMDLDEALEFLEELESDIGGRIAGIKDDIRRRDS